LTVRDRNYYINYATIMLAIIVAASIAVAVFLTKKAIGQMRIRRALSAIPKREPRK
jgi:hypothetical protein